MANLKVVFIGGSGRSGSTVLDNILGQLDGFASLGECNEIWKAGLVDNRRCGCGSPLLECDFWKPVIAEALGGAPGMDIRDTVELKKVCRIRTIPRMAWPSLQTPGYRERFQAYCDLHARLLNAISVRSGAHTIVDSSKTPSHAYMLSALNNIDLHLVQLVRDSRAVSYSWKRIKRIPGGRGDNAYMVRINPWRSAMDWNLRHFLMGTLGGARGTNIKSHAVVKYEEFAADPRGVLARLLEPIDPGAAIDPLFQSPSVVRRTRVNHTIEGNPSKFRPGNIEVRSDDEWHGAMAPLDRAVVAVLTAPYLRKFGYV